MEDEITFHHAKKKQGLLFQWINLAFFAESEIVWYSDFKYGRFRFLPTSKDLVKTKSFLVLLF